MKVAGGNEMNRIFLITCVFFALLTTANAGELYRCVDRDGSTILTGNPSDGMKCELKEVFRDPTPAELEKQSKSDALKAKQKSNIQQTERTQARPEPKLDKCAEARKEATEARKAYYKAQYEGDKTPAFRDPKRAKMFETQKKEHDCIFSQ